MKLDEILHVGERHNWNASALCKEIGFVFLNLCQKEGKESAGIKIYGGPIRGGHLQGALVCGAGCSEDPLGGGVGVTCKSYNFAPRREISTV
jgi:hypothetical protein